MKKTLIAIMALSGSVFGADNYQELWTLDFTKLQRTGSNVIVTLGDYTFKVWDGTLSSNGITTNYTSSSLDRVHIVGDTGVTWGDDFAVEVVFTIPTGFDKASNWPCIFNMFGEDNDDTLRFGPYTGKNSYGIDGVSSTALVKPSENEKDWTDVTLTTDVQHTALLSVIDGAVVLSIDGMVTAKGTLNQNDNYFRSDIVIDNMLIGGREDKESNWGMDVTVSSLTMYKLVPEPTTATLSLLALAGWAARRRRK